MELVVDANSVIAALIKEGMSAEILSNPVFNFFAPEFLFEEIEKYKDEILRKSNRNNKELIAVLDNIKEIINVYHSDEFSEYLESAKQICPDENDTEYFALALKLKCGIWSNDKKLKEQDRIKIYSTEELVEKFEL